jgi:hypothetical protein
MIIGEISLITHGLSIYIIGQVRFDSEMLIVGMLLMGAWKYGKLKHPATYLAVGVNLFNFFLEPIGKSENVQLFLKTIIKG